jgi:hypothetical protein
MNKMWVFRAEEQSKMNSELQRSYEEVLPLLSGLLAPRRSSSLCTTPDILTEG